MLYVVRDEEVVQAKDLVSSYLTTFTSESPTRRIIKGDLKRMESGMLGMGKKWQNR